jgi:DNA-binding MarR family transcriptional regulator
MSQLSDAQSERLLEVRDALRRFSAWSSQQAKDAGLTSAQHQLLLAVRGHHGDAYPTVGEVAEHLGLRHHSAVELAKRAEVAGLLSRRRDAANGRLVRLHLTNKGQRVLDRLSGTHLEELRRLAPILARLPAGSRTSS